MGKLKTYFAALFATLSLAPLTEAQTPVALPSDSPDLARFFATCAGRYAAAREHAWLMSSTDPLAETRLAHFDDLLDAVRADAFDQGLNGPQLLDARIRAKMAQARLLTLAQFHTDPGHARRAGNMARRDLRSCETALLG